MSEWLTLTTQATTDVGKDAEKEDLLCTAGENANWYSPSANSVKTLWSVLKKLKIELLSDPAIALLGIYPRDTGVLF